MITEDIHHSQRELFLKKTRVLILQPTVPEYRLSFFEHLSKVPDLSIRVIASENSLTARELKKGNRSTRFDYSVVLSWFILGGRLIWQGSFGLSDWLRMGDVLVVCGNPRYLNIYPLILQAKRRGVSIVWWGHGWTAGSHGFTAWLRRKIMKLADVVLLYTDTEVAAYISLGFDPMKTFATNNALDQSSAFQFSKYWDAVKLKEFQVENSIQNQRILLFCGRLTPKAELEFLIQAMPQVINQWQNTLLVVIGNGPELSKLQLMASNLQINNHIRWMGSVYDEAQLAPWFLSADVFVYPGSIGLSVLHAMGYGLPVITHSDSKYHMPEFSAICDGKNSLTYLKSNLCDFMNKLSFVFNNNKFQNSLSENALYTVKNNYTLDKMVYNFSSSVKKASQVYKDNIK